MLQRRHLITEYIFGAYFLLQLILPSHFTWTLALIDFTLLSICQYYLEGFRTPYMFFLPIQFILLFSPSTFTYISVLTLYFFSILYFPTYKLPNPSGKYLVGYKIIRLHNPKADTISSFGIYYPTDYRTIDIGYAPNHKSWERFADVIRFFAEFRKVRPLPKWTVKLGSSFLECMQHGVNLNATIIRNDDNKNGFPVVVFSHGLSANIHLYSVQLKEWASNGFIVFSVDHDEEIYLDPTKFSTSEASLRQRSIQLGDRKQIFASVLDLVYDTTYIRNLFSSQDIRLDYSKIFTAGHSFGGATAAEVAAEDQRITGGVLLLDAWLECCDERILYNTINKPVLSFRSNGFDRMPVVRQRTLKYMEYSNNSANKGQAISGLFDGSLHNASTDMLILMPKELSLLGKLMGARKIAKFEDQIACHLSLTKIFLETAVEYQGSKGNQSLKDIVLTKYKSKLRDEGRKDMLVLDN